MRFRVISPAINQVILRLFDHSSQGISLLLENLKPLFQCKSIQLTRCINEYIAANDIHYHIEDDWLAQEHFISAKHPYFKVSDKHCNLLILKLKQDDNLDLILQFSEHSLLKQCLRSSEIKELIPHIKQAVLIADQISQQRGDIDAIHYVITHHPLSNLQLTQNATNSLDLGHHQAEQFQPSFLKNTEVLASGQSTETLTVSANGELELSVSKAFLKQLYKLTPSEAELAKLIFNGLSLQKISDLRSVSKQTIRKQLQSVIKKTNCESQEALIIEIFEALLSRLN